MPNLLDKSCHGNLTAIGKCLSPPPKCTFLSLPLAAQHGRRASQSLAWGWLRDWETL